MKADLHCHTVLSDGAMRVDGNSGNGITYEPNSGGVFQEQPDFKEHIPFRKL